MTISLIVAHDKNRAIGKNNELPWHLPDDLRWFKNKTLGHTIVMGRKTFDAIGNKPLSKRRNIVITRNKEFNAEGIGVVYGIKEALDLAREHGEDEVFIAGGQQIYEQFLPLADKLYITLVNAEIEDADAFFPDFIDHQWEINFKAFHPADEKHAYDFTFTILDRKD